ncbi:MAG: hypothetical protein NC203_10140 [Firmicutes bacterium]|nr:hypothetical protein [[Eubacterium] siraeum]MCM1488712.1 hypothetical protein [Bacillota bacterium]
MRTKKFIALLCAAAVSVSALAATVSAASDSFESKFNGVTVTGNLSANARTVSATAFMKDDPSKYHVFKAKINLDLYQSDSSGQAIVKRYPAQDTWNSNGGCSYVVSPDDKYYFTSAKGYFKFNVEGVESSTYILDVKA